MRAGAGTALVSEPLRSMYCAAQHELRGGRDMRGLESNLAKLRLGRALVDGVMRQAGIVGNQRPAGARTNRTALTRVADFGANPGALGMLTYVPERLASDPALVVVLHGCTQDPAGYNDGSGWSDLADRHGFALLFPEQTAANNPKACFDWFLPGDTTRDKGEALSIRNMIEQVVRTHGIDLSRIYVTGLSAGGAMAAVMLATYPEVFAAGAIIAGLPFGAASNVQEALNAMFQGRTRSPGEWGDLVRAASQHEGPWPRVSVWHGGADQVVKPGNAAELVKQWTDVHGLPAAPTERGSVDGHSREVWKDASGAEIVERVSVAGMGHGTPLAVGAGEMEGGTAGAFMLDVGISSTHHIATFFGLTAVSARPVEAARHDVVRLPSTESSADLEALDGEILPPGRQEAARRGPAMFGVPDSLPPQVLDVIQNAFQAAGLVKR